MTGKKRDKNPDSDYLVQREVELAKEHPSPSTAKLKKLMKDMKDMYPEADLQVEEILLIEGNSNTSKSFQDLLESQGFAVRSLLKAKDALSYLKDIKPMLILLDISLPDMTGFELAQKIREIPQQIHVPMIAFTANTTPKMREHIELVGCDDLIEESMSLNEVVNLIRSHLGMAPV